MSSRFASGKKAIGICDRCGFQFKLKTLRTIVVKTKNVNLLVCGECWEQDHPQLQLGMYPVDDPQALRNPRPDNTYQESRDIQWGWDPVGLANPLGLAGLVSDLEANGQVGSVTVVIN
jgi:hypothetical protein